MMPGCTVYLILPTHGTYLNTVEGYEEVINKLEEVAPDSEYIEVTALYAEGGDPAAPTMPYRTRIMRNAILRVDEWTDERWESVRKLSAEDKARREAQDYEDGMEVK